MKTNVYIDGFNLYYRAVKDTPYKWLDLAEMCRILLPSHQINRIRYFTARVQPTRNDQQVPIRQQTYLRALRTISNLTIHEGLFKPRRKNRPLVFPVPGLPRTVWILDTEEKGSDVNLATYLLVDGYDNDYEQALVVSNDSDLALAVRMVRDKLHLPVGVVNPNIDRRMRAPAELTSAATFTRQLRESTLRSSQFPQTLTDINGTFTKPSSW